MSLSSPVHCLHMTAEKSSSVTRGPHRIKLMQVSSSEELACLLLKPLLKIPLYYKKRNIISIIVLEPPAGILGRACWLSYLWLVTGDGKVRPGACCQRQQMMNALFLLWSCSQYEPTPGNLVKTQIPLGKRCTSRGGQCFREVWNTLSSQLRGCLTVSGNQFIVNTLIIDLVLFKPTAESRNCKFYSSEHLHEMQFHLEQHSSLFY